MSLPIWSGRHGHGAILLGEGNQFILITWEKTFFWHCNGQVRTVAKKFFSGARPVDSEQVRPHGDSERKATVAALAALCALRRDSAGGLASESRSKSDDSD